MQLIIPRIADATRRKDLKAFVNRVLEKWFRMPFSAPPRIISCRILSISDSMGVTERHGLIDVSPDDAALRVIKKLNGAYLKTKRVGIKKYDRVT
ncbi:MAG: hypothetical protein WBN68_03920 [Sedimenticolaceae bacterium]